MKISNQKAIERTGCFIICLIPISCIAILVQYLQSVKADVFIIVLFILNMLNLIILLRLRYTEFENSGFVVTVYKRSLWQQHTYIRPHLEFPADMLISFSIRKHTLCLTVKSGRANMEMKKLLKIDHSGFSDGQIDQIIKSLKNMK